MAYYRTEAGKLKKRLLNRRRHLRVSKADSQLHLQEPTAKRTEGPCHEPIIGYVCMVVSLIEGRRVSPDSIFCMVEQIWRQHRLFHRCGTDYL